MFINKLISFKQYLNNFTVKIANFEKYFKKIIHTKNY